MYNENVCALKAETQLLKKSWGAGGGSSSVVEHELCMSEVPSTSI